MSAGYDSWLCLQNTVGLGEKPQSGALSVIDSSNQGTLMPPDHHHCRHLANKCLKIMQAIITAMWTEARDAAKHLILHSAVTLGPSWGGWGRVRGLRQAELWGLGLRLWLPQSMPEISLKLRDSEQGPAAVRWAAARGQQPPQGQKGHSHSGGFLGTNTLLLGFRVWGRGAGGLKPVLPLSVCWDTSRPDTCHIPAGPGAGRQKWPPSAV